jgi:hypothetical protein
MAATQKLKVKLLYEPAKPFPSIYLKECKSGFNKDTCTPIFTAVLFTISKLGKQPRYPTTD